MIASSTGRPDSPRRRAALGPALTLLVVLSAVVVCSLVVPALATAAGGDLLWRRLYAGPHDRGGVPSEIALAPGGGAVYVAGWTGGQTGTGRDLALVRYTSAGRRAWARTLDGIGDWDDEADAIAVDAKGNVYLGGFTSKTHTDRDFLVVKYSASGVRLWKRTWGGADDRSDEVRDIALDARGNVYAGGWSDTEAGEWDAVLVKWTAGGRRAWVRRFDGGFHGFDSFTRVVVDKRFGRVYAGGSTEVATADHGWLLTRYGLDGVRAWAETPTAPSMIGGAPALAMHPSRAIVQGGVGATAHYAPGDAKVALWTPAGAVDWLRTWVGSSSTVVTDLAVAHDGTIVAVGQDGVPDGAVKAFIVRYTADARPAGSVVDDVAGIVLGWQAVALDAADNIYVVSTRGADEFSTDFVTAKYSPELTLLWSKQIGVTTDPARTDEAVDIVVRGSKPAGVYVTGNGERASGGGVWLTVKYRP